MDYPKFEKVNDNTIRIISEKVDEVPLKNLIDNLKELEKKRDSINQVIDNLNTIISNAIDLGIVPEEKKE